LVIAVKQLDLIFFDEPNQGETFHRKFATAKETVANQQRLPNTFGRNDSAICQQLQELLLNGSRRQWWHEVLSQATKRVTDTHLYFDASQSKIERFPWAKQNFSIFAIV
jgi:hypothetical protein